MTVHARLVLLLEVEDEDAEVAADGDAAAEGDEATEE